MTLVDRESIIIILPVYRFLNGIRKVERMKKKSRLRQKFTTLTIGKEILAALFCAALLPTVIVGLYGGWQVRYFLNQEKISYNHELVRQAGQKLDYLTKDISNVKKQLIVHVISSPLFYQYDEISLIERIREINDTNAYLDTLRQIYPFIAAIYIVDSSRRVYSSLIEFNKEKLLEKPWIEELFLMSYGSRVIPLHQSDYAAASIREPVGNTISFVQKVKPLGNIHNGVVIQIDLYEQLLNDFLEEFPIIDGGYVLLQDSEAQILASRSVGESLIQLNRIREFYYSLENVEWSLVAGVPMARVLSGRSITLWIFVLLVLAVLLLSALLSVFISRRITGPLYKVIDAMELLGKGDFSHHLPYVTNSDLLSLVNGINRMRDHLQILIANIARKEEEKNRARLNALQAQINPHFLYNTLDVIRGISHAHGNEDVVGITASLAKIFRYSIGSDEVVTIERELENIKHYLNIQESRFGDRFRTEILIDEEILKYRTVKLILQPLVENAFKYGLEEISKDGELSIRGEISGDLIKLVVENTGPGIDPDLAEKMNKSFNLGASVKHGNPIDLTKGGLGLNNVDARLKLYYGMAAGVRIDPGRVSGTKVTLTFPLLMKRESL